MSVTGSLGVSSLTEFRTQEARWIFYLSQIFTDEQKPFCEQGELTNACRQATDITEFTANVGCNALCSLYAGGLLWARNVRLNAQ